MERGGKLIFYTGFALPVRRADCGELSDRRRAVGRAVNTASQQALAQRGSPAVAAWIGSARALRRAVQQTAATRHR